MKIGTGDWGHFGKLSASLGIGDWGLGIGDWGLGIGLIYSLLITPYSLLITPYYWGLEFFIEKLRLKPHRSTTGFGKIGV
ncbi:MAG: hypothetical protein KA716_07650 [Gloeotrichia echinulata DEX184]|nr:hypothetical protein [Gloeotrichia echinulata DEX184]